MEELCGGREVSGIFLPERFIAELWEGVKMRCGRAAAPDLKWVGAVVLLFAMVCAGHAHTTSTSGDVVVHGNRPQLMFACDSDTPKLQKLFADLTLIPDLQELHAGIALSLEDLSPERAQVVRRLNEAAVPVVAWMALPHSEGYYLNANNAPQAEKRFADFEKWTADERLHWAGVGLDIEPSLGEWTEIQQGPRWRVLTTLLGRVFDGQRVLRARTAYQNLIREMQRSGYEVQTYQLIFLADERRAHSTVLERLFGIVDVRGNDEALMIYSSFNHALAGALVWAYGPDAQTIAVGSTASSGDPKLDSRFPPLNWDEFSRDLIVASHFSKLVGVYSLEGCVHQGFLPKLKSLDWDQTVTLPAESAAKGQTFRRRVQTVLWIASHVVYIGLALLVAIVGIVIWWRRRRKAKWTMRPLGEIAASTDGK